MTPCDHLAGLQGTAEEAALTCAFSTWRCHKCKQEFSMREVLGMLLSRIVKLEEQVAHMQEARLSKPSTGEER